MPRATRDYGPISKLFANDQARLSSESQVTLPGVNTGAQRAPVPAASPGAVRSLTGGTSNLTPQRVPQQLPQQQPAMPMPAPGDYIDMRGGLPPTAAPPPEPQSVQSSGGPAGSTDMMLEDMIREYLQNQPDSAEMEELIRQQYAGQLGADVVGGRARMGAMGMGASGAMGALEGDIRRQSTQAMLGDILGAQQSARQEQMDRLLGLGSLYGAREESERRNAVYDAMIGAMGGESPIQTQSQQELLDAGLDADGDGYVSASESMGARQGSAGAIGLDLLAGFQDFVTGHDPAARSQVVMTDKDGRRFTYSAMGDRIYLD